ncbi:hypothetical protein CK203_073203 [Vitis vinifera]|uniref:Uncharacterized protein n=1 Tax=Vitis vinifera TaxID=29760 RepID=A0A438ENK6_VITVI|nr:hypothetical protein CK203_073203 [Vitis vinifera]
MWLKEDEFKDLLKGWWQGFNYSGSYSFILTKKLKALKIKLKEWNSEVFGKVGVNKRLALDKVSYWDNQERLRVLNDWELESRKEAKEDFKKMGAYGGDFVETKVKTDLAEGRGVVRAFQSLLSDPGGWRPSVNNLEFDSIGAEESARLELMFTVEEVFLALSELNGDKAPGPDGQILDAALIANEVIDSLLKRKESGVLCKLDLEKAYDRINWDFLLSVMQKMGFGEKWAGWIKWCLSTASFSVLTNGSTRSLGLLEEVGALAGVGRALGVRFWKDTWCGNTPLCEAYPSLFDLAVSKDARVADCGDSMGEVGGWNPRFLRPFNDWEVEEVERLLLIIQGKRLNADLEDRMVWNETKDGFLCKILFQFS